MEPMRTIGYICPKCGKAVIANRTVFALQAGPAAAVCDCGDSEFISETDGLHFRLTVPCGICGGEHLAQVDAKALLQGQGIALSCPETKQLCCYIGEESRVRAAMKELEITAGKLKESSESNFADSFIMYEFLSELRDIAGRGGISCTCGSRDYAMAVRPGAVDLVCKACGGKLRLPAATDEDLDRLCCQYTLTIRGRDCGKSEAER